MTSIDKTIEEVRGPKVIGGIALDTEERKLRGRTFMFYGPFGGGKTRLAATATAIGRTFWIITDANTDGILMQFPKDRVESIHIARFIPGKVPMKNEKGLPIMENKRQVMKDAMVPDSKAYYKFVDVINDLAVNKFHGYDFVIIDSLTTIGDMCMDMILIRNGKTPLEASPEIQHYGQQVRHLMGQCGQLVQEGAKYASKYAIAIAHDKVNEDKKLGIVSITPSLTGQAGRTIGKEYEEVYYLTSISKAGKSGWQMRTRGDNLIIARTQLSNLPDIIPQENLNMEWLIKQREVFVDGVGKV